MYRTAGLACMIRPREIVKRSANTGQPTRVRWKEKWAVVALVRLFDYHQGRPEHPKGDTWSAIYWQTQSTTFPSCKKKTRRCLCFTSANKKFDIDGLYLPRVYPLGCTFIEMFSSSNFLLEDLPFQNKHILLFPSFYSQCDSIFWL